MIEPQKELSEKDFIQDDKPKKNLPFWVWLSVCVFLLCLLWGGSSWYAEKMNLQYEKSPFLQVTNREFSLFLWQFPERMRASVANKTGYLPGFQFMQKVSLDLTQSENYVIAPPELIFLYHTWNRQISDEFSLRPIPYKEFIEFLDYAEEWQPKNWPAAPAGYKELIEKLPTLITENLATLPESSLPLVVRKAFQGWKNYTKEGDAINAVTPTFKEMISFLETHPKYARNFWRNILFDTHPKYLETFTSSKLEFDGDIPKAELASFLKVGFYNYQQSLLKH